MNQESDMGGFIEWLSNFADEGTIEYEWLDEARLKITSSGGETQEIKDGMYGQISHFADEYGVDLNNDDYPYVLVASE